LAEQRLPLSFLAHRVRIQLEAGAKPRQTDLEKLLRGHLERRRFGIHDFIADTLVAALRSVDRDEEAEAIRNEYLRKHRRDRSPITVAYPHLAT
jgi:hypothetical protein